MIGLLLVLASAGIDDQIPTCRGAGLEVAVAHYAAIARENNPRRTAAMYVPDGVLIGPGGAPVTGPAEIEAFLAGFGGYKLGEQMMTLEFVKPMQRRGDFMTGGIYRQSGSDAKGTAFSSDGRFDADWRCTKAGWRVLRMSTNRGG